MSNMLLIADSGSTKTDWMLLTADGSSLIKGSGINPIHQPMDAIRAALPVISHPVEAVRFYGSGCTEERIPLMTSLLQEHFSTQDVEVCSDMLGAARALCGRQEGMACILGTGANSCLYDGEQIVQNTPALGYILGDEGSGAVLGRRFMNAIFKRPDFAALRDDYLAAVQLTQADIIQRVYREPMANRFLASTSLYIGQHIGNPLLRQLVTDNFRDFFRCNLLPYGRRDLPVGIVGSMAFHYREQLDEAAEAEGFTLGAVMQSPLEGLIDYYQRQ